MHLNGREDEPSRSLCYELFNTIIHALRYNASVGFVSLEALFSKSYIVLYSDSSVFCS